MLEQTMEAKYGAPPPFCEHSQVILEERTKKGARRKYREAGEMERRQPSYQEEPRTIMYNNSYQYFFRFHFDSGVVYGRLRKLGRVFLNGAQLASTTAEQRWSELQSAIWKFLAVEGRESNGYGAEPWPGSRYGHPRGTPRLRIRRRVQERERSRKNPSNPQASPHNTFHCSNTP